MGAKLTGGKCERITLLGISSRISFDYICWRNFIAFNILHSDNKGILKIIKGYRKYFIFNLIVSNCYCYIERD